jgi:aldehyde dehydrogenase (NAD+)
MSLHALEFVDTEPALYRNGSWEPPLDGRTIEVVSPATEEPIGRAVLGGPLDVEAAVGAARAAFDAGAWAESTLTDRIEALERLAAAIEDDAERFGRLLAAEVGSPLRTVAGTQAASSAGFIRAMIEIAQTFPWTETRHGRFGDAEVRRVPVGVVGAIVPWNYPLSLAVGKIAPALIAGCTVVLKPSEETPLSAILLAELADAVGLPPGVLNVVPADRAVSELLVRHPDVDKISFTGSTMAGRRIASLCAEQIKRCTLELGGKSAAILLDDVDLADAIPALAPTTMLNNGQTCVNQTRVLAPRARYGEVVDALTSAVEQFRVGDPLDPRTDVGPLLNGRQQLRVERYIATGLLEGARITTGGGRPAAHNRGHYVEPTVFADVENRMTIAQEEIFGPVVAIIPYDDEPAAVAIANDSSYGLAGSVWSADPERAKRVGRRLRTGNVGINGLIITPEAPFGGFKNSGLGREMGPEGLSAYTELQSLGYRP